MRAELTASDGGEKCVCLNQSVGRIIRKLRRERKMSGEILGGITGYSQQQISRYERGVTYFTLPVIMQFAGALEMNVWELLDKVRVFYITGVDNYHPHEVWGGNIFL